MYNIIAVISFNAATLSRPYEKIFLVLPVAFSFAPIKLKLQLQNVILQISFNYFN